MSRIAATGPQQINWIPVKNPIPIDQTYLITAPHCQVREDQPLLIRGSRQTLEIRRRPRIGPSRPSRLIRKFRDVPPTMAITQRPIEGWTQKLNRIHNRTCGAQECSILRVQATRGRVFNPRGKQFRIRRFRNRPSDLQRSMIIFWIKTFVSSIPTRIKNHQDSDQRDGDRKIG